MSKPHMKHQISLSRKFLSTLTTSNVDDDLLATSNDDDKKDDDEINITRMISSKLSLFLVTLITIMQTVSCTICLCRANLTFEKILLHTGHIDTIQSIFTLYMSM